MDGPTDSHSISRDTAKLKGQYINITSEVYISVDIFLKPINLQQQICA